MGRPIEFDRDRALDRAMQVFWDKGFDGASLSDLTAAMGIQAPSLYCAFGNKRKLFDAVLKRYLNGPAAFRTEALEEPTAYDAAARILRECAELLTSGPRRGCMTIQSGMTGTVRKKLTGLRLKGEGKLRLRFERAKAEGDLPRTADAGDLARFIATISQGMTVQAIDGATREELLRVAEMALRAWPGSKRYTLQT
jgi:AcrR family transcriptional regulator